MHLLFALFFFTSVAAFAAKTEFSGNLEAQTRQSTNNQEAKGFPLGQNWDKSTFNLLYGNLNGKVKFDKSTLEANWFVRYTSSPLYHHKYVATNIYTFPNKLVSRDLFQLQYKKQTDSDMTESVLNKLYYEWDVDGTTFMFGRMYINYGQGEIFNPLNPFNQPTGLTSIQQVAQGNDGAMARFFLTDKHTVELYLLGDKRIEGYNGQISRTIWAHGEYQYSDDLQLDYVLGEDQKRNKAGGQASYRLKEAMIFSQVLYQSTYIDHTQSQQLWDVMGGFDQQFTTKWHLRLEGGYQQKNRFASLANFTDRFLPTEYFVAIANQYEIHPLVKLSATLINDIKSGFDYGIIKTTFDLGHSMEAEVFGYSPVGKGKGKPDNVAQKIVTSDIGAALRAFF
jgi:hypothetical protein